MVRLLKAFFKSRSIYIQYMILFWIDMQGLTYKYYRKNGTKTVYIILHGGGALGGRRTSFRLYLTPLQPLEIVFYVLIFRTVREEKGLRVDQN